MSGGRKFSFELHKLHKKLIFCLTLDSNFPNSVITTFGQKFTRFCKNPYHDTYGILYICFLSISRTNLMIDKKTCSFFLMTSFLYQQLHSSAILHIYCICINEPNT